MKTEKTEEQTVETETAEEATVKVNLPEGREERLEKISRNHILASMGLGLIPVPFVDLVALTGVQLNMIRKISAEYNIPFKEERGKSIISALIGGLFSLQVGITLSSVIKCIPVIGQTTGAVAMPIISGASTYAIYKVFVQHFEAGGTILDLDPTKVKSFFREQFTQGKKAAADLKTDGDAKPAA
jgi:uncharacterized protein (DUF697 family)